MPIPNQIKDREYQKFKEDANGDTAVNICSSQLQELIDLLTVNSLIWNKFEVVVPASSIVVVDVNLLTSFSRIKYFLNFQGQTSLTTKGLDLTVQNNNGTLSDSVATRLGGIFRDSE
jgi:hypothetical protein